MKDIKLPSEKRKKIWGGKSFYAVLAVCLVAVCVAGYVAIERSLSYTRPIEESPAPSSAAPVDKRPENIPEGSSRDEPDSVSSEESPKPNPNPEPTLLMWPVNGGKLMRAYSADALVFSPTMQDWRVHNGADISGDVGTAVRAMAAGEVKSVYEDEMLGWVVEIAHGSYIASYCNMQEGITVSVGDTVSIGDQIGGISDTARLEISDAPHLHLEVRKNGGLIDPMSLINNTDIE